MFAKLNYILKFSHKRVKFVLAKAHFAQPAGHKVAQISFLVVCEVKIGWYTQFWILVTMGTPETYLDVGWGNFKVQSGVIFQSFWFS